MDYWFFKWRNKMISSNKPPSFISSFILGLFFIILGVLGLFFNGVKTLYVIMIVIGLYCIVINNIIKLKK